MSISLEEIDHIAKLARLRLTDEEKQKFVKEFSSIFNYLDQLKEVQDKVADTVFDDPAGLNLMRDDIAEAGIPPEELLKSAPNKEDNLYKVKSVMD